MFEFQSHGINAEICCVVFDCFWLSAYICNRFPGKNRLWNDLSCVECMDDERYLLTYGIIPLKLASREPVRGRSRTSLESVRDTPRTNSIPASLAPSKVKVKVKDTWYSAGQLGISVTGHPLALWSTQLLASVKILKLSTDSFETRI